MPMTAISIICTPVISYKATFPIRYTRKCSFMKMASKGKKKNFTSSEIYVPLSDPQRKICNFSSVSSGIREPAKAKQQEKIMNTK